MTQTRIYLDYAATVPLRVQALEAMRPFLEGPAYNASSLHREGRAARAALEEARERIARVLRSKRSEIVFTGGGSESDALAIVGLAGARAGKHVLSCATEHAAVLGAMNALAERGYEITTLPVDCHGALEVEAFAAALRDDTALATVMYANNEIGTIAPIERLAEISHERNAAFHTDAIAAAGWLPLDVGALRVDSLALAAHKFGGPKGFGLLYIREGTPLAPLVPGGGQERGRRAGTEDVAAAAGTAAALEAAYAEIERCAEHVRRLRDRLERGLLATVPLSRVNGSEPRLPDLTNLSFSGVRADLLAARLDLEGIAVSPGSACTSGVAAPSHVIAALGTANPSEAIRISLAPWTTEIEIDRVLQVIPNAVSELRRT